MQLNVKEIKVSLKQLLIKTAAVKSSANGIELLKETLASK